MWAVDGIRATGYIPGLIASALWDLPTRSISAWMLTAMAILVPVIRAWTVAIYQIKYIRKQL